MYSIEIYDEAKSVKIQSAGGISNQAQIVAFLFNHTNMSLEAKNVFAKTVVDALADEDGYRVYSEEVNVGGRKLLITATWEG